MPAQKKDASARRRANTASSRATLPEAPPANAAGRPRLPQYAGAGRERWHPRAVEWWRRLWDSPMASQLLDGDLSALLRLVRLEHDYWSATSTRDRLAVAAEIRLEQQAFGLTPYDRRRLEWTVTPAPPTRGLDTAPSARAAAVGEAPRPPARPDPRASLSVVTQ